MRAEKFGLFDNWFKVGPDQLLNGYYFNPAFNGSTDPSGSVTPFTGWDLGGNPIPGTGPGDAMPWSGDRWQTGSVARASPVSR